MRDYLAYVRFYGCYVILPVLFAIFAPIWLVLPAICVCLLKCYRISKDFDRLEDDNGYEFVIMLPWLAPFVVMTIVTVVRYVIHFLS